jgi:hypothetical protein
MLFLQVYDIQDMIYITYSVRCDFYVIHIHFECKIKD